MTAPADFVHLRVHSHYSLLTATAEVEDLVQAAAADGQRAMALTDNGNLFGAIEFYKACTQAGIKPILGVTAYLAARSMREPTGPDNPTSELTLLAADAEGWTNLRELCTQASLHGFSYRPRVDLDLLQSHRRGLVALTGGLSSQVAQALMQNDPRTALASAERLRDLFGQQSLFLEAVRNDYEPQQRISNHLRQLGERLQLGCVATNDVHYLKPEDWKAQEIVLCIREGRLISDQNRFRMPSHEMYLKPRAVMAEAFADWPEALAATVAVAERCSVKIEFGKYHLPVFKPESGEDVDAHFVRSCHDGARARYGELSAEALARLEYEIGVIRKLGFASYFLVVRDFILKSKQLGIPVGPGRGSAAGSIVAYALQITDVDPLRYGLLFERFLNPGRIRMPDIDIDFCGDRRDEVIRYVRDKYGADCVSQIITFGTMASRGVLRDVGRVLEVPLSEIDPLVKKVPQGPGASLEAALASDSELKALRSSSENLTRLFDLGLKLEGLARHASVHAAGVVIADRPLHEYVPLCKNGEDVVTQWQMTDLEDVGLLKMDFLGLKTLTILQEAVRLVQISGKGTLDLDQLPLDDRPTYELIARGETEGVFQLESGGMRDLLARLKPDTFEDVIAVLALYRPGPLNSGMVDMFVRRKHGEEPVEYPHQDLQPVLATTYGVIVYQEQVMQIANVIAGFSMSDADNLRKAMCKKKPEVMAKFKDQFVQGAKSRGYDHAFARDLFEKVEYFAGYGFNKSHSTAYALLTFRTAWLKAHHPLEFTAANLTVESGNSDKIKQFVDDARRSGVKILPPCVNRSERRFSVEQQSIRYGLGAVKGVGSRAADLIAQGRAQVPYPSLEGLCERVDGTAVNKTALEALVKAGAFDALGRSRKAWLAQTELALRAAAVTREDRRRGQRLLFGAPGDAPPADDGGSEEWPENQRLAHEKEALGFYLSGHPFEKRGAFLTRLAGGSTDGLRGLEPKATVRLAGMISAVRVMQIKSGRNQGQKMARFQLEDLHGHAEVTCFARVYQQVKERLVEDAIVFVDGRIDQQGEERSILCDQIEPATEVVRREVQGLVLHLHGPLCSEHALQLLQQLTARHRGNQQLLLDVDDGGTCARIRCDAQIRITDELLDELAEAVGPQNISFTRT